jgi:hypothetical protein
VQNVSAAERSAVGTLGASFLILLLVRSR